MTRTNIVLDEGLVNKARRLTGFKTMRDVVHYALKELVRHRRQKDILQLEGRIHWTGDLSKLRQGRSL